MQGSMFAMWWAARARQCGRQMEAACAGSSQLSTAAPGQAGCCVSHSQLQAPLLYAYSTTL